MHHFNTLWCYSVLLQVNTMKTTRRARNNRKSKRKVWLKVCKWGLGVKCLYQMHPLGWVLLCILDQLRDCKGTGLGSNMMNQLGNMMEGKQIFSCISCGTDCGMS